LATGGDDLFGTVENLQVFTSALARDDEQVRALNRNLASVADQLEGERDDLALALQNLAVALQEVSTFVQENRQVLGEDLAALEEVTGSVASQQAALAETLESAPVALSNLQNAYNPAEGTLDTRNNSDQLSNPALFLCSLLSGAVSNATPSDQTLCDEVLPLLAPVLTGQPDVSGLPLGQLSRIPSQPQARSGAASDPTLGGILEKETP
jgi:phospholipid/cholesterol/gamma-HCH transport system substrate-binding protein